MPAVPSPEPNDGHAIERSAWGWPENGPDDRETLAEIDAEIVDHLCSAAEDLVRRGRSQEEAEAASRQRFGDVAWVRRKCWWIQQGELTMFRWLAIGLMSTLIVAVLALAAGGWRVQTALADRIAALTDELASMHEAQQRLLDRGRDEIPEVQGRAYLADESRQPAEIEVIADQPLLAVEYAPKR